MQQTVYRKAMPASTVNTNKKALSFSSTPKRQRNSDTEVVHTNSVVSRPFHLSMCVSNLDSTRNFYKNILGIEERRVTESSVHFNFYGCQLTFHEVPGYSAKTIKGEVDTEHVPVPHFGAALTFEEFEKLKDRLLAHRINFFKKPRLRFVGKAHEHYVMFLEDPSGHGIEIKLFTKVPTGHWA